MKTYNALEMTTQEVFNAGATHLLTQKCRSERPDENVPSQTRCMYRGPEGRMCGAGIFIPEDKYQTSLEGGAWSGVGCSVYGVGSIYDKEQLKLINRLQIVHDGENPEDWKQELRWIANNFNLNADVLDAF